MYADITWKPVNCFLANLPTGNRCVDCERNKHIGSFLPHQGATFTVQVKSDARLLQFRCWECGGYVGKVHNWRDAATYLGSDLITDAQINTMAVALANLTSQDNPPAPLRLPAPSSDE